MADWNNPNPINTNPGGDTVYNGFVKTQSSFNDVYSKLNIVKKLQSGTTAPSNPAVGELWFDETTGILKRYDGTNWVDVVAIPDLGNVDDLTILNKLKNVDGAGSGLDADLVRGFPADFTGSLSGNGYQKLPSGLIIQWGIWKGTTPSDFEPVQVTFPIAFPNIVYSLSLTPDNDNDTRNEGVENVVAIHNKSNSGFSFMKYRVYGGGDNTETYTVNWIAIGY